MTMDRKVLVAAVVVIWTIMMLQIAASIWYLYWVLPWYDILMHFLGGLWLGLMVFALAHRFSPDLLRHPVVMILVLVSGTLLIGFMWELLEFFIDILLGTNTFQPDLPDTMADLGFDILGSLVAAAGILVFAKKKS
jgi:hypothetical protein